MRCILLQGDSIVTRQRILEFVEYFTKKLAKTFNYIYKRVAANGLAGDTLHDSAAKDIFNQQFFDNQPMSHHHFISYSVADAKDFALRLCDMLIAGPPEMPVWIDKREFVAGPAWDKQIVEAIRDCDSMIFVMTRDSVESNSNCNQEWTRALKYKKPIIPILLHDDAEMPFRLEPRQYVDFTGAFEPALARLRQSLQYLASPAGVLQEMKDRLADAQRDLRREKDDAQRARIQDDITQLEKQVADQQRVVNDPEGAAKRVQESIERGLERERQPAKPVTGLARSKFINPPPGLAPIYFQDRLDETKLTGKFLQDEALRLLNIVGRGGVGKTAMVCRLLKMLESGQLPDDLGALDVDGIVYLSATGSRRVNFPNLFADLSKLLTSETAERLDALYKNPQAPTEAKMRALLEAFPTGRTALLLDNFEDLVDPETLAIRDAEVDEALRALLNTSHHVVKVIITTRLAPRDLMFVQPGRQRRLDLDEGLPSPYAENILREMDADGKLGLKAASAELLDEARKRTRGYPRALEALFAILSADRDTSLPEVLRDTAGLLPQNVVEALVGEAFSRLDAGAQQVMQALAIYGRPVTPAALDYLLQPHAPGINSAAVLSRLVNMQFARKEAGHYYLHPVDRSYALNLIPRGSKQDKENFSFNRFFSGSRSAEMGIYDDFGYEVYTQFALLYRAANYFEQARRPRVNWKMIEDLAPQLAEFDLRCEGQDYDTAANVLHEIFGGYLMLWGHSRLAVVMYERLQNKILDLNLAAWCLCSQGVAHTNLGEIQQAIDSYEQALLIFQQERNRAGECACLGNLGSCYDRIGQLIDSISYTEQALVIAQEIGYKDYEGSLLGHLGIRYQSLGQLARAIEYHEKSLAIARLVNNQISLEGETHNLASCYKNQGQIDRAIELYEQALVISRSTGYRDWEANHLGALGSCYANFGQTTRAIEYHERALTIRREIGNRPNEGHSLKNLGYCFSILGQTTKAIDYYNQALTIAREASDPYGEGSTLDDLAIILIDQGNYGEAIKQAFESITIGKKIGIQLSYRQATLALAYLYSDKLKDARAAAETARQYNEPQNNHYTLALLGLIELRQKDPTAAQEAFAAAVSATDELLSFTAQNYAALDTKGLALCGLTLCDGVNRTAAASEAYRAARAINRDAGIVARVLRLFDALVVVDAAGVLKEVRAAAAGE